MQTVCPTSEVSAKQLGSRCSVLQSGPNADNGLSSNGTTPTNPQNLPPQLVLDAKVVRLLSILDKSKQKWGDYAHLQGDLPILFAI